MEPIIIKGCPRDKWEEVQSIQHQPFIYIQSNGSRWAGEEEGDIAGSGAVSFPQHQSLAIGLRSVLPRLGRGCVK